MILTATKVAITAAIGSLACGCARNMLQTAMIVKSHDAQTSKLSFPEGACASTEAMIAHLNTLSRPELLCLFLCSPPPGSDYLSSTRDWNGILLDNNNLGMTTVGSKFMSNNLFGRGRKWNGKTFLPDGKGINRFRGDENGIVHEEHSFDWTTKESRIQSGSKSVCLHYQNYQPSISLWATMTDEVRCLPCDVMIGLGSMAWSGGMLNSAPFCLYPSTSTSKMN